MSALTYLISWTCYGQWLHGDSRGSVDPDYNAVGEPWIPADPVLEEIERVAMAQAPYEMDAERRRIVLEAIRGVCEHRKWTLHAVHVRSNHVHVVVTADRTPERVMNDFKSYASRALNEAKLDGHERRRWTRHGSTRYINNCRHLNAAINYVLHKQGEPMARWPETPLPDGRGSSDNSSINNEPRA